MLPNGCILLHEIINTEELDLKNFELCVGDGIRIYFWHDSWVGGKTFKKRFPRLYELSLKKHQMVSEFAI